MRVEDRNPAAANHTGRTQETQRADLENGTKSGAARAGAQDRVEVSSLAGRVSGALDASATLHAARVERLASLYASGAYTVDARKVSHAIVSDGLASRGA